MIRDQLRPFSVKAQPTAKLLAPATERLAQSTPGLTTLARELNNIVNELAYKPKHGQSYLFYLPWANHNTNSVLSSPGRGRPAAPEHAAVQLRDALQLLQGTYAETRRQNPTLLTLLELLDLPNYSQYCKGNFPK